MHNTTSGELLLTSQVARILGVSAQSVRQWERAGRLRAVKTVSGVRLFERAVVDELRRSLEARQIEPLPAA